MSNARRQGRERQQTPWATFIRHAAATQAWTIKQLAEESGISRSTFQRWLSGELKTPSIDNAKRVAVAAGLDPLEALRAAGHLADAEDDWEVQMIRESRLPQPVIDRLVLDTIERQARERESRRAELERQIELLRGAVQG